MALVGPYHEGTIEKLTKFGAQIYIWARTEERALELFWVYEKKWPEKRYDTAMTQLPEQDGEFTWVVHAVRGEGGRG